MGIKSNNKCPHKTEEEKIQPRQEDHVRIEAEFGLKETQAQGHLEPLEAEDVGENVLERLPRELSLTDTNTLILYVWPQELWENKLLL